MTGGAKLRRLCTGLVLLAACSGEHEGPGKITPVPLPPQSVAARAAHHATAAARARRTPTDGRQIVFGDLHAHTTFSLDAFALSLPMMGGEGAHPPADACDFARFCAALDFWSINDHAEGLTPRHWTETLDSIRHCNAVAGDPSDPDLVSFLGWEWTQVGDTPESHYGHKNVVLRDTGGGQVPTRPISAWRPEFGIELPWRARLLLPVLDFRNRQRYFDQQTLNEEIEAVAPCPEGVDVHELPTDCRESARTPRDLFEKLDQWGFESLVIPHGTSWGLSTPPGASFDLGLVAGQHDRERQRLFEIYSGHGSAEEYRAWRAADFGADGAPLCPAPSEGYLPCCWRAGEIIRERCEASGAEQCEARTEDARRNFVAAGAGGYRTVPGAEVEDWLDCGQCEDCFQAAFDHRPGMSAQYALATARIDDRSGSGTASDDGRFRFGLIGSSDTHRARPGNGYKELARLRMTDSGSPPRRYAGGAEEPIAESRTVVVSELPIQQRRYTERQASFYVTGGLVAAHSQGRSREAIWDALERREVYGTSGERILLWFDLLNGPGAPLPMGSETQLSAAPRFRVSAAGAFEQRPGCPGHVLSALGSERTQRLCAGECYHPSDTRRSIARIEVVRIQPRRSRDERIEDLVADPWRSFACPDDPAGCSVEFEDPGFVRDDRETLYYVRAIQEPTPAVNGERLRCRRDAEGRCVDVTPCYADARTPPDDDCLAPIEERAWSSPIFLEPAGKP